MQYHPNLATPTSLVYQDVVLAAATPLRRQSHISHTCIFAPQSNALRSWAPTRLTLISSNGVSLQAPPPTKPSQIPQLPRKLLSKTACRRTLPFASARTIWRARRVCPRRFPLQPRKEQPRTNSSSAPLIRKVSLIKSSPSSNPSKMNAKNSPLRTKNSS